MINFHSMSTLIKLFKSLPIISKENPIDHYTRPLQKFDLKRATHEELQEAHQGYERCQAKKLAQLIMILSQFQYHTGIETALKSIHQLPLKLKIFNYVTLTLKNVLRRVKRRHIAKICPKKMVETKVTGFADVTPEASLGQKTIQQKVKVKSANIFIQISTADCVLLPARCIRCNLFWTSLTIEQCWKRSFRLLEGEFL